MAHLHCFSVCHAARQNQQAFWYGYAVDAYSMSDNLSLPSWPKQRMRRVDAPPRSACCMRCMLQCPSGRHPCYHSCCQVKACRAICFVNNTSFESILVAKKSSYHLRIAAQFSGLNPSACYKLEPMELTKSFGPLSWGCLTCVGATRPDLLNRNWRPRSCHRVELVTN